jgi:hypothetical protein
VADTVDAMVHWTSDEFKLSPALPVDADTRRRVEALAAGFAERQRPLYERWVHALIESPQGRENPTKALSQGTGPRWFAALADWRLRQGGAAHEALLRQAAVAPSTCRVDNFAGTSLDEVAALVQAVVPARRDAFMDGERQLLAQWGLPPPVVPAGGEEPGRDIARWVQVLRRGEPHDTLPMAPLLAGLVTAEPVQTLNHAGRCAIRQWWLANRLRQSAVASEAVWQAWHLAFARDLMTLHGATPPYPDAGGSVDYPPFALQLGLVGSVTVGIERDARGRYASGTITKRELTAGTLPGRAVPMFEPLLDAPSLARARKLINGQAAAAAPGASAATAGGSTIVFQWRMP